MFRPLSLACAALVLGSMATASFAQEGADSLQAKYEKKVSESWFTENGFTDDYDVAMQRAKEGGKPIFAYFTRSYSP